MGTRETPLGGKSTKVGLPHKEVLELREFRNQLGRSMFVGGTAQEMSSGLLQEHLQQLARFKHCTMLLAGTQGPGEGSRSHVRNT